MRGACSLKVFPTSFSWYAGCSRTMMKLVASTQESRRSHELPFLCPLFLESPFQLKFHACQFPFNSLLFSHWHNGNSVCSPREILIDWISRVTCQTEWKSLIFLWYGVRCYLEPAHVNDRTNLLICIRVSRFPLFPC